MASCPVAAVFANPNGPDKVRQAAPGEDGDADRFADAAVHVVKICLQFLVREIPDGAENVIFSYNPAFMMGGENFELKFDTDSDDAHQYAVFFSRISVWEGKPGGDAEKHGIFSSDFDVFGYPVLPEDFTIYLTYSIPYRPDDWNHGQVSVVAVSEKRSEILFHAEDW